MNVYPTDTSRCELCGCSIKATQYVALYMVGSRADIGCTRIRINGPLAWKTADLRKLLGVAK